MAKKIEIEIPEGKCAKWVNGVLTLVDEKKPQDVTERIKTFEDACEALSKEHLLVKEYWRAVNTNLFTTKDLISYLKLRIICGALNEGWKPTLGEDGYCYYPWFYIFTESEYNELSDNEKKTCHALSSTYVGNSLGYIGVDSESLYMGSSVNTRPVFKTRELAEYCGKQFIDIWIDFLFNKEED